MEVSIDDISLIHWRCPRGDIDEVVKEAVLVRKFLPDKAKGLTHALLDFIRIAVPASVSDAKASEPKAGRGNAGQRVRVAPIHEGAVLHLAAAASFGPEKVECAPFDFVQEIVIRSAITNALGLNERRVIGASLSSANRREKGRAAVPAATPRSNSRLVNPKFRRITRERPTREHNLCARAYRESEDEE